MIESRTAIWFVKKRFSWKHVIWFGFDFYFEPRFEQITNWTNKSESLYLDA